MDKWVNRMNDLRIPDTIEAILEWSSIPEDQRNIPESKRKNKTKHIILPQNMRNEEDIWPKNMEVYFRKTRTALAWGDYSDVIYSFLSIYALGVWSYNSKDLFKLKKFYKDHRVDSIVLYFLPENRPVRENGFLCSIQNQNKELVAKLNSNESLKKFAKMYFSIGNMMPIWPAGNAEKGSQMKYYFDIPELYYAQKNTFWFNILNKQFPSAYLNPIYEGIEANYKKGMSGFFDSIHDEESYNKYLDHIITVIRTRTENIEKWLAENVKKIPKTRGANWEFDEDDKG